MVHVTKELIEARLREHFPDAHVRVRPFSGHDHFEVHIVSGAFEGLPLLARHRLVYSVLEDLLHDAIHALSMTTITPRELEERERTHER